MKGTTKKVESLIVQTLKDSEIRYRRLFEAAQDGILILDAETGLIEDVNPYLIKMLGYSREEFVKKKLWEVGAFKDIEASKEAFEALQENEYIRYEDLPLKAKDGRLIQVEFVSNVYQVGSEKVIQCNIRDFTEHKRAEDAHQESDARFRRLVEHLPTVIYTNTVGDASIPLYISPHIKTMLGYTPEEWLADPKLWSKTLHPEDRQHVLAQAAETNLNNKPFDMEYRMVARDGHLVWVHDQFILVTDPEDQLPFWQGIMLDITERKQAEAMHAQLASIIDSSDDAIIGKTLEGVITSWNSGAERLYGYSVEEAIGQPISLLNPPDRPDELSEILTRLRRGENVKHFETVRLRKDGARLAVSLTISPIKDTSGQITGASTIARDITARKQAEEELKKSEGKFRVIFDNASDGMFIVDLKTRKFFMCNTVCAKMLGYAQDEFLNLDIADIHLGEDMPFISEQIGKFSRGEDGIRSDIKFKRKNGSIFASDLSPALLTIAGKEYLLINFKDITERKLAEEALRESEEHYRQIIETAQEGIWTVDTAGRTTLANQRLAEIFGYTVEEMIGKSIYEFLDEEGKAFAPLALENRQKGINKQLDFKFKCKDGSTIWALVETSTLLDHNHQYIGGLAMLTDITARKQAEAMIQRQLEHLTALSAIDRVIAGNFDLQLSLSEILTHVTKELGVDAADILLLDPGLRMLEFGAEHGFRTKAIRKAHIRLGESYAGRAAQERRLVQIPNLKDEPDNSLLITLLKGEDFVCYYGVPLISKGQVKGVLDVFRRSAHEPDAEWFGFLNTLAGQAAIAIENSTLFEHLQRSNSELFLAYDATIEGWSHALDLRDKETEGHTQRVTEMTVKLAHTFGISETDMVQVRWGALLHDIGKMGVPDGILLKPGPLTDEEWVAMKKHPTFAYEMLSPIGYLRLALDIPYCHHEKWDGTGYPRGLKGAQIPLVARIFAVVDVWDALKSDRPYRLGWTEEKVREHIRALSGTHFDPQVVDIFMQHHN